MDYCIYRFHESSSTSSSGIFYTLIFFSLNHTKYCQISQSWFWPFAISLYLNTARETNKLWKGFTFYKFMYIPTWRTDCIIVHNYRTQGVIAVITGNTDFTSGLSSLILVLSWFTADLFMGTLWTIVTWNKYKNDLQSNFVGSNSSGPSVRVRPIHVFERYLAWQFSS